MRVGIQNPGQSRAMPTRKKSTESTAAPPPAKAPRLRKSTAGQAGAAVYEHKQAEALIRPEVGVQPRFEKRKPPSTYAYDPSLAPTMQWDGQNPAREQGEALIARIEAAARALLEATEPEAKESAQFELREATAALKGLSRPFLEWAGKAERASFDVPTLPLFIHERLSTQAILESLKGGFGSGQMALDFFGHPERDLAEQLLKAYEFPNGWFNRMILGDSLVVMNSLLHYEHLAGQVQMIYIDPPYGVKFGSNFQPFVRKRDVTHGDDDDLTREPEMVKAYRDTWELGLHSYLTYLRDRLLLARELLTDSGSVFVQISDENLHHVREVMDEVFGVDCFNVTFVVKKKGSQKSSRIDPVNDYIVWYGKRPRIEAATKFHALFDRRDLDEETLSEFNSVELEDGTALKLARLRAPDESEVDYRRFPKQIKVDYPNARLFRPWPITNGGSRPNQEDIVELNGKSFRPPKGRCWSFRSRPDESGASPMDRLRDANRLWATKDSLDGKRYLDDFPFKGISNWWDGFGGPSEPLYVVQTNERILERCILMTTDPGDLVLDPTCGSGTTAYVAEQWGRRWITIDTSRVPLALARQRLLTAAFDYHELKDPSQGPAGGFVYRMKQNKKGEHVGGIVPHVTLKSIANGEPPDIEVLVDRPEVVSGITRVTGPFVFEATIPTAQGFDEPVPAVGANPSRDRVDDEDDNSFVDRMVGVLQASPVLHLPGNQQITLTQVRRPARAMWLGAEAVRPAEGLAAGIEAADAANGGLALASGDPVAIVFGPAHGSVTRRLVEEAWGEAQLPGRAYKHLYVIGFAIEPDARQRIDDYYSKLGLPVTYVQATPDVLMGDLLKNMRSSQIFSVCGQPEITLDAIDTPEGGAPNAQYWQVKLLGLDVFNPASDEIEATPGRDVPAWFLDTDYNGLVFRPRQAFFPATGAWDNLKRALKADFDDSVWEHLAGDTSEPFVTGTNQQIAVKVIDHRGNELMVVREAKVAKKGKR
jgi:adenine-specific DNA-methyltransferase